MAAQPRDGVGVLTLWEPWASAVAMGYKAHETRGRGTRFRGPLLVHAGKAWSPAQAAARDAFNAVLGSAGRAPLPAPRHGLVLCVVDLVDSGPTLERAPADDVDRVLGDWSPGRYAWTLANVRAFAEPVPWRGRQGFTFAPPELLGQILRMATLTPPPPRPLPLFPGIETESRP